MGRPKKVGPWVPFIISPNEVFSDIMVLAFPPRLPVDPDDVNAPQVKKYSTDLFQILHEGRYTPPPPPRYVAIEI